jgi:hypothetical protein
MGEPGDRAILGVPEHDTAVAADQRADRLECRIDLGVDRHRVGAHEARGDCGDELLHREPMPEPQFLLLAEHRPGDDFSEEPEQAHVLLRPLLLVMQRLKRNGADRLVRIDHRHDRGRHDPLPPHQLAQCGERLR